MKINSVPTNRGYRWYTEAFDLFKMAPFMWILTTFGLFALSVLFGKMLPVVGSLVGDYVQAIIGIGIIRICRDLKRKQPFNFNQLFSEFSDSESCFGILKLKFLTYFICILGCGLLIILDILLGVTFKDILSIAQLISNNTFYLIPDSYFTIGIINFALVIMFMMFIGALLFFATPLIALEKLPLLKAIQVSFAANFKNIPAFLLSFLILFPIFFGVMMTLGLGLIVVLPVFLISYCLMYDDLFRKEEPVSTETITNF